MGMDRYLQDRKRAAENRAERPAEEEATREARRQDLLKKATLSRELLADPRYPAWVELLGEAKQTFETQLRTFDTARDAEGVPIGDASATLLRLGRLQGYAEMLHLILTMPDTFVTLAEQGLSPQGNGRHPNPHRTTQDAS